MVIGSEEADARKRAQQEMEARFKSTYARVYGAVSVGKLKTHVSQNPGTVFTLDGADANGERY